MIDDNEYKYKKPIIDKLGWQPDEVFFLDKDDPIITEVDPIHDFNPKPDKFICNICEKENILIGSIKINPITNEITITCYECYDLVGDKQDE